MLLVRKRVRNLSLRVHPPHGEVRVSAPLRASEDWIRSIILGKRGWIEKHRARLAARAPAVPPAPLTKADRVAMENLVPPLLAKWEAALGVRAAWWGIKRMKTRWGSCNPSSRRIWLNLELMRHPPECLDYVVLHEVAHLVERGHGARFRALLSAHMPDWPQRKAVLRGTA